MYIVNQILARDWLPVRVKWRYLGCSGLPSVSQEKTVFLLMYPNRSFIGQACLVKINLLLTEHEGHTWEYWPEVVAVWTEHSEVRTKTTEGQYSPVRLELARLISSLLYGTRAMLVLNFPAIENKKYTAYDHFHRNSLYGKIPTKKEPIRTRGFALPYNKTGYRSFFVCLWKSTLSWS